VVHGFGRGSKQLGIPTANLDADALGPVVDALPAGIYFGWASVGADPAVHKMVMSVGWCVRLRCGAYRRGCNEGGHARPGRDAT
jgi:FAD synthase